MQDLAVIIIFYFDFFFLLSNVHFEKFQSFNVNFDVEQEQVSLEKVFIFCYVILYVFRSPFYS